MAKATTVGGSALLIKVGDGAEPTEQFTHPCSINAQRGLALSANTQDTNLPDCDDPEAPDWIEREITTKDGTITGAGTLHADDQDLFFDWFDGGELKNVKVFTNRSGATGGRIYTGAFLCTNFEITGAKGEKVQCNITLKSSGAIVKTNNT